MLGYKVFCRLEVSNLGPLDIGYDIYKVLCSETECFHELNLGFQQLISLDCLPYLVFCES